MIRRAVAYSLAQRYCEMAIHIVSLVIIARFVPPAEFGVYAIAAAMISLASLAGAVGVTDYLVTTLELTRDKRAAALGLMLTTSASVGFIVMAIGFGIVRLGGDTDLALVLTIMATTVFIDPWKHVAHGLLRRDMLFGPLVVMFLSGAVVQAAAGIGLSVLGFGAPGLAIAFVLNSAAGLVLAVALAQRVGGYPIRFHGWDDPLRFGWRQAAVSIMLTVGKAVPTMLAGLVLGYAAAGLLSRSLRITSLFNDVVVNAVNRVALPVLSRQRRDGQDLRRTYLVHFQYVSVLSWPIFIGLALWAPPFVDVLLGGDWLALIPLVRILCLVGVLLPVTGLLFTYYTAIDRLDVYLRRQIIAQSLLMVTAVSAAFLSVEWLAAALALESAFSVVLALTPLHAALGAGFGDLWRAARPSLVTTTVAVAPMAAMLSIVGPPGTDDVLYLAIAILLSATGWLIGIYATNHPLSNEMTTLARLVRSTRRRR